MAVLLALAGALPVLAGDPGIILKDAALSPPGNALIDVTFTPPEPGITTMSSTFDIHLRHSDCRLPREVLWLGRGRASSLRIRNLGHCGF